MALKTAMDTRSWDSWEPLVGGLPLLLRLILLQYCACLVVLSFLLAPLSLWLWEAAESARLPEPLADLTPVLVPAAYAFVLWFWLRGYQAKRQALAVLGILSVGSGAFCAALIVRGLPTAVGLGLAALLTGEGLYLLRLSEWVGAHPADGGVTSSAPEGMLLEPDHEDGEVGGADADDARGLPQ